MVFKDSEWNEIFCISRPSFKRACDAVEPFMRPEETTVQAPVPLRMRMVIVLYKLGSCWGISPGCWPVLHSQKRSKKVCVYALLWFGRQSCEPLHKSPKQGDASLCWGFTCLGSWRLSESVVKCLHTSLSSFLSVYSRWQNLLSQTWDHPGFRK